jgi:pimeloyl-ACP methyl ester carboxylesterase
MGTVECAFEELGNPASEPLIILHGFFASSRNWRQVAEKLAANYHVYVLDLRNHGLSPHHPVMDYPAMAVDLLVFMNNHALTRSHLLGHSMGGKIAMWFALNHPERVDKLIVADIAPVSYTHCFNNLIQALKELPLSEISNRKQAEQWLAPHIPELSYRQFLLQNLTLKEGAYCWRVDLDIFKSQAPNIIAFPEVEHLSPYLGIALFLGGADSKYVKAEAVSPLFPHARINMIANAGHWLHVQQPVEFLRQVENFLA